MRRICSPPFMLHKSNDFMSRKVVAGVWTWTNILSRLTPFTAKMIKRLRIKPREISTTESPKSKIQSKGVQYAIQKCK